MKTGILNFAREPISPGALKKPKVNNSRKLSSICLIIISVLLICQCENNEKFYRPNLPEQLCSIGIIDVDDTTNYGQQNPYSFIDNLRYISFEKSFQSEFSDEKNDSLRNFSFTISSADKELINYHCDSVIKNLKDFKLPLTEFRSGEKYFLKADEESTNDISAEITVPQPSSKLTLNSIRKETIAATQFSGCRWPFDDSIKFAVIDISFYSEGKSYYALLLEGIGINFSLPPGILGYLDFSIKESNIQGFSAVFPGSKMYHLVCNDKQIQLNPTPIKAFFMDGRNMSDNKCDITLLIKFNDGYSLFNVFTSFRIKLLSIPRELYLFEKSLYTYDKVSADPFSEPVYLNGNIKHGNGVFAICRSTEISLILPFPPMF